MEYSARNNFKTIYAAAIIVLIFFLAVCFYSTRPPKDFPDTAVVAIADGTSVSQAAQQLKAAHVIRSTFWFTNFVILLKHERKIADGEYYFEKPLTVFQ